MNAFKVLQLRSTLRFMVLPLLLLPGYSMAQAQDLLPSGQTLLTLTVTERQTVQQDILHASLRIESENRDAQALQNHINSSMTQALEAIRSESAVEAGDIKVSTGRYSVYQYNRQPQGGRADIIWRGSQTLTLEGRDAQTILDLAGEVQESGFIMNQLSYQLSNERADEVRDSLMESAIARALEKAERAGRAMGRPDVEIAMLEIDTETMMHGSPVMMRNMVAEDSVARASPVAEAGESEVQLTIRVTAVAQ